jgi:hypothetical protein
MARKRFLPRRSGFLKPKNFIVVATEGRLTEERYLAGFHPPRESVLQLLVLPSKTNKSRPRECLKRLLEYARNNGLGPKDQLWVMIDRDRWAPEELDEVARELSKRDGHHLALSNPCVEYWFLLHFQDHMPLIDASHALRELKRHFPQYTKDGFDLAPLIAGARAAIRRAERQDRGSEEPWPTNTGSHVYRLVRQLIDPEEGS